MIDIDLRKKYSEEKFRKFRQFMETQTRLDACKQLRNFSVVYAKKGRFRCRHTFRKYGYAWPAPDLASRLPNSKATVTNVCAFPSIEKPCKHKELPSKYYSRKYSVFENEADGLRLPEVRDKTKGTFNQVLLRQPTTMVPPPILETEETFQSLANSIILRSIVIEDSQAKTFRFYSSHYPLLLEKSRGEEDSNKILNRRNVVRETREQLAERRSVELNRRIEGLHSDLKQLEHEMTDGVFTTELRNQYFDPRIWPWNKDRYIQPPDSDDDD
ncbi:hypothetical protein SNE40_011422 [Patella caerulea]|uniref:Uncharacterized protein n=1 Tax=Patella caerulea TaxID=87958 RepID=A0AAN8JJU9_PATCE